MDGSNFRCEDCDNEIIEYYNHQYKGRRGKCSHCKKDFPLE